VFLGRDEGSKRREPDPADPLLLWLRTVAATVRVLEGREWEG
jgi:hypothetical protein